MADQSPVPDDLSSLGVKAVEINTFESALISKIDTAIDQRQKTLEARRLVKARDAIIALENRLESSSQSASSARVNKLLDRLEELRVEEYEILKRIKGEESVVTDLSEPASTSASKFYQLSTVPSTTAIATDSTNIFSEDEADAVFEKENSGDEGEPDVFADDSNEKYFIERVSQWLKDNEPSTIIAADLCLPLSQQNDKSLFVNLVQINKGFSTPTSLWERVLPYQKQGVLWLCDLFSQQVGGILGDEMGLGKTIQAITFIMALQASGKLNRPVLVVCPVTLMKQWVNEFHLWGPTLRVMLLHSSNDVGVSIGSLVRRAFTLGHIIVTSYGHLRLLGKRLLKNHWQMVILDEGHKIRNPDAEVTLLCKQLRTPHRLILSGTPIQNNLVELWSLFDFCFPGRLGTLPIFKNELAIPISAGGYVNAGHMQIQTSYKCACILRDLIRPYLLRRVKADVAQDLPPKNEQVLFCQITPFQRQLYESYLESEDVKCILEGKRNVLAGIDVLRKICNHPDLTEYEIKAPSTPIERSGKMAVLAALLKIWKQEGHRTLLFCQTRQMLDLVEAFIRDSEYYYLRMDGTTPVHQRTSLVDEFNRQPSIFVFLLTTRVGGLGINLTGADRVLIYDPDWNPSTDLQARERAWRLGQTRPVTIYRLITVGTIEEKIYHRQIFKQYLTNKILLDPKQTRFFKAADLYDLFTLGRSEGESETAELFSGMDNTIVKPTTGPEKGVWKRQKVQNTDGFNIPGLMKSESIAAEEDTNVPKKTDITDDESHILDSLFGITGLHSAIHHDSIIERSQPEIVLVEREAARRATDASEALKRSQQERAPADVHEPTWTGRSGWAGVVTQNRIIRPNVPSAQEILQRIRQRHAFGDDVSAASPSLRSAEGKLLRLAEDLVGFLQEKEGVASTEDIIANFGGKVGTGDEPITFRQLLKQVATFSKPRRLWCLKSDFEL